MNDTSPFFLASFSADPLALVVSLIVFLVCIALPLALLSWGTYCLLSLPAKREEKARLFLHLVENCLRQGRPIEPAIIDMANTHDRSPGVQFHLLAAYLEEGDRLGDALRKVPRLLPPSLAGLLRAGLEMGDLGATLPACRMQLRDARSGMTGAFNYFLVVAFGLVPFALFLFNGLLVFVMPKLREIFESMGEGEGMNWIWMAIHALQWGWWAELGLGGAMVLAVVAYAGGPALTARLRHPRCAPLDWIAWRVPWKRHRMQRNFAAALALLLDRNVPEADALRIAADCAANEIFRRRAQAAIARLAAGEPLTQAISELDSAGEVRWRLANAMHAKGGFLRALGGWLEALDARAFQEEQAAGHILSTAMVVFNGTVVGCACIGVYGVLTHLIRLGILW